MINHFVIIQFLSLDSSYPIILPKALLSDLKIPSFFSGMVYICLYVSYHLLKNVFSGGWWQRHGIVLPALSPIPLVDVSLSFTKAPPRLRRRERRLPLNDRPMNGKLSEWHDLVNPDGISSGWIYPVMNGISYD